MAEIRTLARPYALAAFSQARDEDRIDDWSGMLELLARVTGDATMKGLIANPRVRREQLAELIVDVCGERLSTTGQNLVRVLAHNGRLDLVAAIGEQFEFERARTQGRNQVEIRSAFELTESERAVISAALVTRLGGEVELSEALDPSLIGGVVIRAGDLVIDASLRGRLDQFALALG